MVSENSNAERLTESASRPGTRQRKGASLSTILKAGVTLLIFGYIIHSVDLSAAWQRAAGQNLFLVVLAALIFTFQAGLGGLRWLIILRALGAKPPASETFKLFYVAIFFNSYVPGGVGGDVIRAWLSYRRSVSARTAITSVILDRVAALVGVAVLILLIAPTFLARLGISLTMLVPILVSMVGLIGIVIVGQFERLPSRWLGFRPLRLLHELGGSVRLVFLRPTSALPLVGVAILGQIALGVATYTMAVSLDMNISFLESVFLMQPVALVANLPISVAGWGVRETAMIMFFGLVGVPASASLVLSIQLGLLLLIVALPGGLIWLAMRPNARRQAAVSPP